MLFTQTSSPCQDYSYYWQLLALSVNFLFRSKPNEVDELFVRMRALLYQSIDYYEFLSWLFYKPRPCIPVFWIHIPHSCIESFMALGSPWHMSCIMGSLAQFFLFHNFTFWVFLSSIDTTISSVFHLRRYIQYHLRSNILRGWALSMSTGLCRRNYLCRVRNWDTR